MNLKKEFLCFSNHLWIDSICLGYLSLSRSIAIWSCLNNCDWRKMFKLVGILIFEDPPTHLSQPYNRPQLKLSESTCMSFQPTFHSCSSHIPIQTSGESGTAVHIWHRAVNRTKLQSATQCIIECRQQCKLCIERSCELDWFDFRGTVSRTQL